LAVIGQGLAIGASLGDALPEYSSAADHEFVQIRSFPASGYARLSRKRVSQKRPDGIRSASTDDQMLTA